MSGKGAAVLEPPVISIIDDDSSVRQVTDRLVRSLGYRSATFASAEGFLQSDRIDDTLRSALPIRAIARA
jgi:FixJ family two-component response regulator